MRRRHSKMFREDITFFSKISINSWNLPQSSVISSIRSTFFRKFFMKHFSCHSLPIWLFLFVYPTIVETFVFYPMNLNGFCYYFQCTRLLFDLSYSRRTRSTATETRWSMQYSGVFVDLEFVTRRQVRVKPFGAQGQQFMNVPSPSFSLFPFVDFFTSCFSLPPLKFGALGRLLPLPPSSQHGPARRWSHIPFLRHEQSRTILDRLVSVNNVRREGVSPSFWKPLFYEHSVVRTIRDWTNAFGTRETRTGRPCTHEENTGSRISPNYAIYIIIYSRLYKQ